MNKLFSIAIIITLFVRCENNHNDISNSCINTTSISQKINRSGDYKLDSVKYSNHELFFKIRLLEMNFYILQIEREFIFHSLSNSIRCENTDLDSVKVLLVADSIQNESIWFLFNYNDIAAQLSVRDSANSFYYYKAITYLINKKDYRSLSIILVSYFGDVVHNDSNLMHNDVDFFDFLMAYSNDIKQRKNEANTYDLLDQLQKKIMNDKGLHLDIKNESLDFIHFLEDLKPKSIA